MDASSLHNDWWQKIRNLWNPPMVKRRRRNQKRGERNAWLVGDPLTLPDIASAEQSVCTCDIISNMQLASWYALAEMQISCQINDAECAAV